MLFTVVAIRLIDYLGRRTLLIWGVSGMIFCLFAMGMFEFSRMVSLYKLPREKLFRLKESIQPGKLNPYFDINKKIK